MHRNFRHPLILWDERGACIQATARKSDFLLNQGISLSTAGEAANSGSLSHTDCWGKAPLEVLVGRWPTSLIESWESAPFSRRYGVHGAFLEVLCWNWCSYRLDTGVSENPWSCPKEAKKIVLYDGDWGLLWSECRGIGHHFKLIWATPSYFTFLQWHQCPSRLVRDFWGTLCTSVKQINAPYQFDWEQGIALFQDPHIFNIYLYLFYSAFSAYTDRYTCINIVCVYINIYIYIYMHHLRISWNLRI